MEGGHCIYGREPRRVRWRVRVRVLPSIVQTILSSRVLVSPECAYECLVTAAEKGSPSAHYDCPRAAPSGVRHSASVTAPGLRPRPTARRRQLPQQALPMSIYQLGTPAHRPPLTLPCCLPTSPPPPGPIICIRRVYGDVVVAPLVHHGLAIGRERAHVLCRLGCRVNNVVVAIADGVCLGGLPRREPHGELGQGVRGAGPTLGRVTAG